MGLFYTKNEYQDEIVITYATWPNYATLVMLGLLLLSFAGQQYLPVPWLADAGFFGFMLLMIGKLFSQRKVTNMIKDVMKTQKVTLSGSRYSFKNPIKFTITKQ